MVETEQARIFSDDCHADHSEDKKQEAKRKKKNEETNEFVVRLALEP